MWAIVLDILIDNKQFKITSIHLRFYEAHFA
jgi:hypothetical protein